MKSVLSLATTVTSELDCLAKVASIRRLLSEIFFLVDRTTHTYALHTTCVVRIRMRASRRRWRFKRWRRKESRGSCVLSFRPWWRQPCDHSHGALMIQFVQSAIFSMSALVCSFAPAATVAYPAPVFCPLLLMPWGAHSIPPCGAVVSSLGTFWRRSGLYRRCFCIEGGEDGIRLFFCVLDLA